MKYCIVQTVKINAISLIIKLLIFKVSSSKAEPDLVFLKTHSDIMFLNNHTSKSVPCLLLNRYSLTSSCFRKLAPLVNWTQPLHHSISWSISTSYLYLFIITNTSLLGEHDPPKIFLFIWYGALQSLKYFLSWFTLEWMLCTFSALEVLTIQVTLKKVNK